MPYWPRFRCLSLLLLISALTLPAASQSASKGTENGEWHHYGGDLASSRYSPLDQVRAENVDQLRIAWRWESPDKELQAQNARWRQGVFKPTPVMADGLLYTSTSLSQVLGDDLGSNLDRSKLLVVVIEAVIEAIRDFEVDAVAGLITEFSDLDAYHQRNVEVVSAEQRISGINRGIDERGQLRLETEQGIELHSAADISLRVASA